MQTTHKTGSSQATRTLSQAFAQQQHNKTAHVACICRSKSTTCVHLAWCVIALLQQKLARDLAISISFPTLYCSPSEAADKPTKNVAQKCCKNYNPVCVSTTRTCSRSAIRLHTVDTYRPTRVRVPYRIRINTYSMY